MVKKILIALLGLVIVSFLFMVVLKSISRTLNIDFDDEGLTQESDLEESGAFIDEEFLSGFLTENENELEEEPSFLTEDLTFEEEMAITEKITNFMSLDQVKNLTTEEWVLLEEKLGEKSLEDLKRMTLGDFVQMLRNIKN